MPPRFYVPDLPRSGPCSLTDGEAHHASHVMRLKAGEPIELFNGRGLIGHAVIEQIQKKNVVCRVETVTEQARSGPEIVLATAIPKGERFDWLVEKATELGVDRFVPLLTAYGTVDPRESKLDRLRQAVIAACKQCRRSDVMDLAAPLAWGEFLADIADSMLIVAHPSGRPLSEIRLKSEANPSRNRWVFAVGPEGGFRQDEIELAHQSGGRSVSLGTHLLRIETAGLALASWGLIQQQGMSLA
jgi:16S rRNA (uracil1498-N3)-methyltransferase